MTCDGCRTSVEEKLNKLDGVTNATVNLEKSEAVIEMAEHLSIEALQNALSSKYTISEKRILKGLADLGVDSTDLLVEGSEWFILEDKRLSPGTYKLKYEKVLNNQAFQVNANEKINVSEDAYPIGSIFGIDIYEATHSRTKQKIYITSSEIVK